MQESERLKEAHWHKWGAYLSDRAWGTVREDYSANGDAWDFFPHDHARSKAYRWGEDGIGGFSDNAQYLCFALACWNGKDPILKERFFGLTNGEGNHGEDVKELYYYLDSTPSHSYMKMLYKYPHAAYPYAQLLEENRQRGREDFEFELLDTGVFAENRYFDILLEYAKADVEDILIQITVTNRGEEAAEITLLPSLWFRNTWSWGYETSPMKDVVGKPSLSIAGKDAIRAEHPKLGEYILQAENVELFLFTENETNHERLHHSPNASPYVKDAFHRYLVYKEETAVNPSQLGTKSAAVYRCTLQGGESQIIRLRLAPEKMGFADFDAIFKQRQAEADEFYETVHSKQLSKEEKAVQRQALAGMLWSKQLYYYDVEQWLEGDPIAKPPASRKHGRNHDWLHLNNFDIISICDKWEYPWFAAWDLAFHCIPLAMVDSHFAKAQLLLFTKEWYMHPNGELPAYEWKFGDVNPPVHAWAAWRVYEMDGKQDKSFLKRIFNKMLLNFTWWVNRKDAEGHNIFQGGFLGLDNISLFDRSTQLPAGGYLNQSDGTAWMGFYCLMMMKMALEIAKDDAAYEDMAIKFYEHFLWIALAISGSTRQGVGLWDEADGFFYDVLKLSNGETVPLKVRSLVGLMPLIAVETVSQENLDRFKTFAHSIKWLREHRPNLAEILGHSDVADYDSAEIFAMPTKERLASVLAYMLDEDEFLSPYGIRSLSKAHETPYHLNIAGQNFSVEYWPAESKSGLFGGNSNWRGPIWLPINYLLIEALRKYHRYYEDTLKVECPTGSGKMMNLKQVADELSRRLSRLFLPDVEGNRPIFGGEDFFQNEPHLLFHEYFHGDNGAGLGASHQTGWTGLIADLLQQLA